MSSVAPGFSNNKYPRLWCHHTENLNAGEHKSYERQHMSLLQVISDYVHRKMFCLSVGSKQGCKRTRELTVLYVNVAFGRPIWA